MYQAPTIEGRPLADYRQAQAQEPAQGEEERFEAKAEEYPSSSFLVMPVRVRARQCLPALRHSYSRRLFARFQPRYTIGGNSFALSHTHPRTGANRAAECRLPVLYNRTRTIETRRPTIPH